jgi:hypothetical protein
MFDFLKKTLGREERSQYLSRLIDNLHCTAVSVIISHTK